MEELLRLSRDLPMDCDPDNDIGDMVEVLSLIELTPLSLLLCRPDRWSQLELGEMSSLGEISSREQTEVDPRSGPQPVPPLRTYNGL